MSRKKPNPGPIIPLPATERNEKQPMHFLVIRAKDLSGHNSRVGAAWTNAKGGLSLKLSRGVVLSWRDCADSWLTLWPNDEGDYHDEVPF